MKTKRSVISLFVLIMSLMISLPMWATSWAQLEPSEVDKLATVVVKGTYDFSSKPQKAEYIYEGYDFHVTEVYRGEVTTEVITVGIDRYDVGWANEFQESGGEFLLFLEENEMAKFLLPVGGPNGMIQWMSGEIQPNSEYFESFLIENLPKEVEWKEVKENSSTMYMIIGVIVVVIGIGIATFFIRRK